MASDQPQTPAEGGSRVGRVVNGLLVALAFGLLGVVVYRNRSSIAEVASRPIDPRLLAPALGCYLVTVISTFFRWYLLVRVIEPRFTPRATLLLGFIGNVFNLVIPGAVGGDVIKGAYLARMHIKRTQAIASMVIDRILGLLGLFVLASIAGAFAWGGSPAVVHKLIVAAWVALAVGLMALGAIFSQTISRLVPARALAGTKLGHVMAELRVMSATYRGRMGVVALAGAISVANHALNVVSFYLVGLTLYPRMTTTLVDHFLLTPLVLFTMAVPLPFGALGLTEGVGKELLGLVDHPNGALAMMGFRLIMYSVGLIGAVVYLVKLSEVRALSSAARELEPAE